MLSEYYVNERNEQVKQVQLEHGDVCFFVGKRNGGSSVEGQVNLQERVMGFKTAPAFNH